MWPVQVAGVHSVTGLALGGAHTLAVRQTDDLMAWGANQNGVLGLGIATSQDACTPVKVPKLQCSQVCSCMVIHLLPCMQSFQVPMLQLLCTEQLAFA